LGGRFGACHFKLCRNSFSTIKLSHEDGGSKAGFRHSTAGALGSRANAPIAKTTFLDLLLPMKRPCIQEDRGAGVIRVAGATFDRLPGIVLFPAGILVHG
jgi:hypothetical protein